MPSGTPLGEMFIELGLDTSHFSKGLQGAKRSVNYFQAEVRALDQVLKKDGNNIQALRAKHKSLEQALKSQKSVVDTLKKSYDEADKSAQKERYAVQLANATAKMKDLESQVKNVDIALKTAGNKDAFQKTKHSTELLTERIKRLDGALKNNGNNVGILKEKHSLLQKAISEQKKSVSSLQEVLSKTKPNTPEWRQAALAVEHETTKLKELKSQLGQVGNTLKTVGNKDAFQKTKHSTELLTERIKQLDGALKGNGNNVGLLQQKYSLLKSAISNQKRSLAELQEILLKTKPNSSEWNQAALAVEKETGKLREMEGQLKGVESALQKVHIENSRWGKLSNTLTGWGDKLQSTGSKLRAMGDAMRPVSTLLSAGFALATRKAIDFEGQMNTTKSLLADTVGSASELNKVTGKLGDASKGWAREYGISTSSINEGMQEIIKKGYDANQTMAAMPAILDASRASGDDFNVVMNASTNILEQFGLKASDTGRVTDTLTYVANKTAAGFADMGNAMEYVGPVAKNVGMSLEETASAVGLLSNNGIAGEKAGTALRGALTRLLKPSKQNAEAMQQLGFSSEEFLSGAIKLPDILDRIKKNTEGLTAAEKSALIAKAFGTEAQTAMNILVDQGGDALRNLTKETENARGYTHKLASELSKSSKNGVERFKASLEVLQITIGQKLLPMFAPLLEKVTNFIENISKASPEVQQFWTNLGLGIAIAYPTLNTLGNISSSFGTLFKVLGKASSLFKTASTIEKVGAVATSASGSVGLLSKAGSLLGVVFTPAGAAVLGVLAIGGAIAYFAQKALDAKNRAAEWGTEVSSNQASQLQEFKNKVDDTNKAITEFSSGAVKDVSSVTEAFKSLADEVTRLADEKLSKDINMAEQLGLSQETIDALKNRANQLKDNVQHMSDEVINIYRNASEQHRELTEHEKAVVLANQNELINTQLDLMDFSAKERVAITKAMNGQLDELNQKQIQKAKEVTEKWIQEENESYRERKENYKKLLEDIKGNDEEAVKARAEIHQKLQELEADHNAKMDAFGKKWIELQKKLTEGALKNSPAEAQKSIINAMKKNAEELGFSYDELVNKFTNASSKIQKESSMWAKTTAETTEAGRLANTQWNAMVWDVKTGQLKTNAQEEIQKALEAEGGWDNLQFILKEAKLETNAKIMIGEALQATGQWDSLSPQEKKLVTDGKPAIEAILSSKEMLATWNSMPEEVKKLLGENENFLGSAKVAKDALTKWNLMTPTEKVLSVNSVDALLSTSQATTFLSQFNELQTLEKVLTVDSSSAMANTTQATDTVNQYNSTPTPTKDLTVNPSNAIENTNQATGTVNQFNSTPTPTKDLTANPSNLLSGTNQSMGTLTQYNSMPTPTKQLNAQDNASSVAQGVIGWLNSIPTSFTTFIDTVVRKVTGHEKGTDFHKGGLAMVNDQKGPLYRELVTLPTGQSFIPTGRNVLMDLPRGSKVLPAAATRKLMQSMGIPKYAQGVGIPSDSRFIQEMELAQARTVTVSQDNSLTASMLAILKEMLAVLKEKDQEGFKEVCLNLKLGNRTFSEIAEMIAIENEKRERIRLKTSSW